MSELTAFNVLMAKVDPFKGVSGGFKPSENQQGTGALVVIIALAIFIVLLWLLARFMDRRRQQGPTNSPLLLFVSLCRAHRLGWSSLLLLWRVARYYRLKDPARLFLEPERLEPANLGPAWSYQARRLHDIQDRLFALPPSDESDALEPPKATEEPAVGTPLLPLPTVEGQLPEMSGTP